MEPHPRFRRRWLRTLLVSLLLLFPACTPGSPAPTEPPTPVIPSQFELVPDAGPGFTDAIRGFATRDQRTVALGEIGGEVNHLTFRYSDDAGATWQLGTLTPEAARLASTDSTPTASVFSARPGPAGGWLALGSSPTSAVAWSSRDGQVWDRHETRGLPHADAVVNALAATPDLWIAVGATGTETKPRPQTAVWLSPDGVDWQQVDLPGEGSLVAVSVRERAVVAVGNRPIDNEPGRAVRAMMAVVSADAGATWSEARLPPLDEEARFATFLNGVTATAEGFLAVGGRYFGFDRPYGPVAMTSTDGRDWVSAPGPQTPDQVHTQLVRAAAIGASEVTTLRLEEPDGNTFSLLRRSGGQWSAAELPQVPGRRDIFAVHPVGTAVLAAVETHETNPGRGAIWRSTDGGASFAPVDFPASPDARGENTPTSLHRLDDGSLIALGRSHSANALWRKEPGSERWQATRIGDDPQAELQDGAFGPNGMLLWGGRARLGNTYAIAWHGTAARTLTPVPPERFSPIEPYHSSDINDALWAGDRWLAVGTITTNGEVRRSALAATSPDGAQWKPGRGERVFSTGDGYGDEDPRTDLLGLDGEGRWMNAVVALAEGYAAFGAVITHDANKPAMWRTTDKEVWTLTELPMTGLADAYLHQAAVHGDTVVAAGSARAAQEAEDRDWLWTSKNGGRDWELVRIGPDERASGETLTATPRGFAYAKTSVDRQRVFAWVSTDGTTWTGLPLTLPTYGEGTRYDVSDLITDGDDLLLLVRVTGQDAAQTVVVRHRVP